MLRLFFKKLNEWITQCSLASLMFSVFLVGLTDLSTAYITFWSRPEYFLRYELNPWIKAAFYHGQWEKLFFSWTLIISLIFIYVAVLEYSKKRIILNFGLTFFITLIIGAALNNLCGIIFNSPALASFVFYLVGVLSLFLLVLGGVKQILDLQRISNKEIINF